MPARKSTRCLVVGLTLLLAGGRAHSQTAPENPAPEAALLPDDATLQAAGARIGEILFHARDIFDTDIPAENRSLFRMANRLHITTREETLRAELLFRSGDPYSRQLLEESERNLRELGFLREPRVRPLRYHDGVVDIEVETHDVWTLQVGPSFGRNGGTNHASIDFEESNLFGRGKKLNLSYGKDVDRTSTSLSWYDPNAFGSRWKDQFVWSDTSDGHLRSAAAWRPFYALNVRRSYGVSWLDSALTDTRYWLGEPYDDYQHGQRGFDLHAGWSRGLRHGVAQRIIAGWRFSDDRFSSSAAGSTLAAPPPNRELSYPYLRLELIRDDFRTTRNLDLIDRTEDLHFGLNAAALLGWASESLGSDRNAAIFNATASYGEQLGERQQLFLNAAFNGRLEQGNGRDLHSSLTLAWYWRTSPRTLLHAKVTTADGSNLDSDQHYTLGGDNGLRGYPLRYQFGSGLALLKIEERLYTDWSLWQLLDVGGAAFVDVGRVWGRNPIGAPVLGWLKDVGIGLRLGNSRSSLGNVIHIDLAAPLDGEARLDRLQLLIGTQATF